MKVGYTCAHYLIGSVVAPPFLCPIAILTRKLFSTQRKFLKGSTIIAALNENYNMIQKKVSTNCAQTCWQIFYCYHCNYDHLISVWDKNMVKYLYISKQDHVSCIVLLSQSFLKCYIDIFGYYSKLDIYQNTNMQNRTNTIESNWLHWTPCLFINSIGNIWRVNSSASTQTFT